MNEQTLQIVNEQAELLSQIGAYLRDLRHHHDVSLEEIAAQTMIPVRTLTAIENGDLKRLPEPVYVQGFIKRYADAMGVDGTEFASAFPTDPVLRPAKRSWRGSLEAQLRPVHLYALYTLLVFGAVSGLSLMLNRSSNPAARYAMVPQQPVNGANVQPQTPLEFYGPAVPGQIGTTSKTASSKPKTSSPMSDKPVRVSLTVKGQQSWLRISVDGKMAFEGVLPQGAQRSWSANQQVIVRAGDAGAVELSYNEGSPKPMGKPGDVQEVTFGKEAQANLESWSGSTQAAYLSQRF